MGSNFEISVALHFFVFSVRSLKKRSLLRTRRNKGKKRAPKREPRRIAAYAEFGRYGLE
jgi:hypothetical protein